MIVFCVSVPVLSVQRISIAPKFWMAFRRLTIAFRRAMTTAPLARLVVTIIGSISGVNPTATDTANSSDCSQSPLERPLMRKTNGVITIRKRTSIQLTLLMPLSKLVSGRAPTISRATAPKNVASPVAATTAVAVPLTTLVPMKQAVSRSSNVPGAAAALGRRDRVFFQRNGFAGQHRLADEQIFRGPCRRLTDKRYR